MYRSLQIICALLICSFTALLGCSTTKPEPDAIPSEQSQPDLPKIEGLDPELATLLFDANTPLVVKFRPRALTFTPHSMEFIEDLPGEPFLSDDVFQASLKPFFTAGSYHAAWAQLGLSDVIDLIDEDRPAYMTMSLQGPPQFYDLLHLGALWFAPDEVPQKTIARHLIPAKDPAQLANHLQNLELSTDSDEIIETRISTIAGHVLLDTFLATSPQDTALATGETRLHRPTPALMAFIQSTDDLALYVDMQRLFDFEIALSHLFLAQFMEKNSLTPNAFNDLDSLQKRASQIPPRLSPLRMRTFAFHININLMHPKSQREFVDHLLTLNADESEQIIIDRLSTRTAFGEDLAHALQGHFELPAFSSQSLPKEKILAEVQFAKNFPKAAKMLQATQPEPFAFGEMKDLNIMRELSSVMEGLTYAMGPYPYLFPTSPHFLPNMFWASDISGPTTIPLAMHARLVAADAPNPLAAAASLLFQGGDEIVKDRIEHQWKSFLQAFFPDALNTAFHQRDDGFIELRLAWNLELHEAFDDDQDPTLIQDTSLLFAAELRDQQTQRAIYEKDPQLASQIGKTPQRHLQTSSKANVTYTRLSNAEAAPISIELPNLSFVPKPTPPSCLDKLNEEAIDLHTRYERQRPEHITMASLQINDSFDPAVQACIQDVPEKKEILELLMARTRTAIGVLLLDRLIALYRDAQNDHAVDDAISNLEAQIPAFFQAGCELGDTKACDLF